MRPLERAARALAREVGVLQERFGASNKSPDRYEDDCWRDHVEQARTVLQAIREPSADMAISGGNVRTRTDVPAGAGDIWRAMIDVALEEG